MSNSLPTPDRADAISLSCEPFVTSPAATCESFGHVWETLESLQALIQQGLPCAPPSTRAKLTSHVQQLAAEFGGVERTHRQVVEETATHTPSPPAVLTTSRETEAGEKTRHDERLRLLGDVFNNAQEGVVILDTKAVIHETNRVFLEIAGRTEEGVRGRPLSSIVEWAFPEFNDVVAMVVAGKSWSGKIIVAHNDLEERSYWTSFSPVTNDGQVANIIVLLSDVTDIDRTQRRLKRQALHDPLTNLPNRRFYCERVQSLIQAALRDQSAFAVCFLDLDDFKHVNDTLGHTAGDDLLIEVSRRLKENAGDDAFIARFGGDEFAILIPHTDLDMRKTATVVDDVLAALRQPVRLCDKEALIGASIGVTYFPKHSNDAGQLLQNADAAMYAAKQAGKNQIRVFCAEMREEVERRNQIQNELQRALRGNEITLHYQPKVDFQTGSVVGCEALARWRMPNGQQVSPAQFVPIAETSGLIVPLGDLVLMTACRQAREWHEMGCSPVHVGVNISPQQLHYPNFAERVGEIFAETGAKPEWIELEITENAVMEDVEQAMEVMDQLVEMGITLALDDFGTGHSSLSYLKLFNIHTLKIDRSFVMDLPDDDQAVNIVSSIMRLGQGRGLSIVAEGVETQAQYDLLREMGCDIAQGYHIAPPRSARRSTKTGSVMSGRDECLARRRHGVSRVSDSVMATL